jgi:hypothetical protein
MIFKHLFPSHDQGGRMRDHQRVIARKLLKVMKSKKDIDRAVADKEYQRHRSL